MKKNSESVHFYNIIVAQQAGGDLTEWCRWQGEDLDGNDSSVEDASDMTSDVEKCQIESLIKKYS